MRLHAVRPADHQHRAVQHLQRALHLCGKIHMPGRVQQRDRRTWQHQFRLFGKNRNPPFAFKRERIQKGIPVIHTAKPFQSACLIKQRFRQSGFAGVNMGKDADNKSFHSFLLIYMFVSLYQKYCFGTRYRPVILKQHLLLQISKADYFRLFFLYFKRITQLLPCRTAISSYIAPFCAHHTISKTPKHKSNKRREKL